MSSKLSLMPNIAIPRSRFPQDFTHPFDMFHGDVVPVDCFEVVPGDEFNYTLSTLIRMSTPALPIMGNIKCYVHAFFVPLRLIYDQTEKFYGDPSNHDKISSITPVNFDTIKTPNALEAYDNSIAGDSGSHKFMYSVSDYLGKQDIHKIYSLFGVSGNPTFTQYKNVVNVSPFKERAYLQIWNDHFRPSSMVPPVLIQKGTSASSYGTASFISENSGVLKYGFHPLKGFKHYDYFTACTLSPQFNSTTVALPLGTKAEVYAERITGSITADNTVSMVVESDISSSSPITAIYGGNEDGQVRLYANLLEATAASWNDIRLAAQLQKYFERSNYGSRFFEILTAHYGITNPDSRLQRAERLGSHSFYINISQVVATADTESGGSGQNLGNTGAVSCTGDKCHLFTKSFSEPGYIMVLMTTKYDRLYSSGWLREDLKSNRFQFYSPEFAHLGDQIISKLELQIQGASNHITLPDEVLGYNEHWAEYRYRRDYVSGSMRPGAGFDIWTLADTFDGSGVTLGYDFLKEDRASLARVLANGENGPDYFVDTRADILSTRELPLYSIPGLIDHFGAL